MSSEARVILLAVVFAAASFGCGGDPAEVNGAPTAMAGDDQEVAVSATVTLEGAGEDADGDELTFAWHQVAGQPVELEGADSASCSFTAPGVDGSLAFALVVSDGVDQSTPDFVSVRVGGGAEGSIWADAGQDQLVEPSSRVMVHGRALDPTPSGEVTFAWTQTAGDSVELSDAAAPNPSFVAPESSGAVELQLVVSKEGVESAPDTVVVNVDGRPIAVAGEALLAEPGEAVTLDGSGSSDPEGASLSYQWTQVAGEAVSLDDATSEGPSFTAPDLSTALLFELVVSDEHWQSLPSIVAVHVLGGSNLAPVADPGGDRSVLNRNTLELEGAATDPEGDAIVGWLWEIVGTPPGGEGSSLTGEASPTAYFTPVAKGDYTLSLSAADAEGMGEPVMFTVHSENNLPLAEVMEDIEVVNTETVLATGSGSDLDGDDLTYSWAVATSPAGASYELDDAESESAMFTPSTKGTYTLELTVNDGEDDSLPATVTVVATNNAPTVDAGEDGASADLTPAVMSPTVVDADGDTLTHAWEIASSEPSDLTGTFSDPSAEAPTFTPDAVGTYWLRLTVTDDDLASASDVVALRVYLLPTDEDHVFVAPSGDDDGGACGARTAPCANLSTAVMLADEQGKDVIVAGGDYVDRARSVNVPPGVRVFGGYDPATWERDIEANPSVITPGELADEVGDLLSDGLDNDCDGLIDAPTCVVGPEICDNRDNDCDGEFDNGSDVCGDELEPNDDALSAAEIEFGVEYGHLGIWDAEPADWFTFEVPALPAGEEWKLSVALRCRDNCSTNDSRQIGLWVYAGGTDPEDLLFWGETSYTDGRYEPVELSVDPEDALTGTYYVRVETDNPGSGGEPAWYDLSAAFRAPSFDPSSDALIDRVYPSCRDAYALGIEGTVPAFVAGDENLISGLTIRGHDGEVLMSLPHPYERYGAVVFCDECALTIEDSVLEDSGLGRRDLYDDGEDGSVAFLAYRSGDYPVRFERNEVYLGYGATSRGLSFYELGDVFVANNVITSAGVTLDHHIDAVQLIQANFEQYGDEQLVFDANVFDIDTSGAQTRCIGFLGEDSDDYQEDFTPLYLTNSLFLSSGGCDEHAQIWLNNNAMSGRPYFPDMMIGNNLFIGTGTGIAIRLDAGHHGSSAVAIVNNYIQDFNEGMHAHYQSPYFANNMFSGTPTCAMQSAGFDCTGDACGDCIATNFVDDDDGLWASRDNMVATCTFADAAALDFHHAPGSPCLDAGSSVDPPAPFPVSPGWLVHDHDDNDRPVDDPASECPSGWSCDTTDIGAYEHQL